MFCDFQDHFDGKCDRPQENCKLAIVFAANVEKCVKLKGELFGSNSIDQVVFRQTAKICAEPEESEYELEIPAVYCCSHLQILNGAAKWEIN